MEEKDLNRDNCKHCEFLYDTFLKLESPRTDGELLYYLMTEVFVYLHGGKDYCDKE